MATLSAPHWEAVTPRTRALWGVIAQAPHSDSFYLAGGTALALRLGHRTSQDLDLFAAIDVLDDAMRRDIVGYLERTDSVELQQDSVLGLELRVGGLPVSYLTYSYPLLDPLEEVSGIRLAGLTDIGLMKLDAIAGRGSRKDFVDLYYIARQISLDELFARSPQKYPHSRSFGMRVLTALTDFDIAEQEPDPAYLQPTDWETVRGFCLAEARRLGEVWFGAETP